MWVVIITLFMYASSEEELYF